MRGCLFTPGESHVAVINEALARRFLADTGRLDEWMNAIRAVDRDQPIAAARTVDRLISEDVAPHRFVLLILGAFAVMALLLAGAGVFGVVLNTVSQRTREIGIRMALGAGAPQVVGLVLRRILAAIAAGLVCGTAGALVLGRLLAGYLYGVEARDPETLAVAAAILGLLGLAAAYVPAAAAARVHPAVTLRCE